MAVAWSRANNAKTPTRWKNLVLKPVLDNSTGENPDILLNSDIVLNGAPCFHDGNSDWRHWAPIDWASIDEPAQLWYGAAYPPQSVRIEGNTHAPKRNGSAVLLIA